jgi:UDP-glucose 4-epimerase
MENVLITGGAGFIGSHIADAFMAKGANVSVLDNLSAGKLENVKQWLNHENFTFIKGDLLNPSDLARLSQKHYEIVFHLAANPEVRVGTTNPEVHFQQNLIATHNLLECIRKNKSDLTLVFTSTSTIYGEPAKIPTPETYSPLKPISIYGATKLAGEALITAYAYTYGFKTIIYRLANIVGPRSQHGIIYDFVQKLKQNSCQLEILGDGTQTKSYLYITDCVEAILSGLKNPDDQAEIYNVGSNDQINVKTIAKIVMEEMKLNNIKFHCTGGVDGGRGWKGDVKNMLLDISRIESRGWKPKWNSEQAMKKAANHIIAEVQSG